ncbi:PEP-CTERM sorting domain-containing protein [Massilia sp. CMS3.1]|uniref:PEP-CTERM sorting domain-containing protein n=1 Tax=Massilia sp. CMS3.1 TaxID=3373083 RepID=UPI003EE807CA
MTKLLRAILIAAAATSGASAHASTITVTPEDMAVAPNHWFLNNVRENSTAAITNTKARNGNGSVEMSMPNGSGKADYVYSWGFSSGRTLGKLDALSYDWFRSAGGSASAHLQPALRLNYDADGNVATTDDRGYLVWEQIYNGGGMIENQWTTSDILAGNFWMRQFTPGNTVEQYGVSLNEWMNGPRPGTPADVLSANTALLGIEFGIGSGWSGSFTGYVDNVTVGFKGQDVTAFNFETQSSDVPEPGSIALLGLGIVAVVAARKRKRA